MLEAVRVSKSYGTTAAVSNLSLAVAKGEIVGLLGANGAGKTTTIHLFLGFLRPDAGELEVGGVSVAERPLEARRRLAYVPEQLALYPQLTGRENLDYFCALADDPPSRARLEGCLEAAGLSAEDSGRRVATYSKGMRQKVGLALALARRADALLLDEPLSGLDPQAASEFSARLSDLARQGTAILMATHDLFRARDVAHRVGIMKAGRLVAELPTSSLSHGELERIYLEHMRDGAAAAAGSAS
jgi:ABC-2 type transport system ATP-binding protein